MKMYKRLQFKKNNKENNIFSAWNWFDYNDDYYNDDNGCIRINIRIVISIRIIIPSLIIILILINNLE